MMSRNETCALIAAAAAIGLSMTPADAARLVEPTGYAEMRLLIEAHPEIDRAVFPGLSAAPLLMGGKKKGDKLLISTSGNTNAGLHGVRNFYYQDGVWTDIVMPSAYEAGACRGMDIQPNGRYQVAVNTASNILVVYDWISGSPVKVTAPSASLGTLYQCKFSPDGTKLIVTGQNGASAYNFSAGVPSGEFQRVLNISGVNAWSIAFHPNNIDLVIGVLTGAPPYLSWNGSSYVLQGTLFSYVPTTYGMSFRPTGTDFAMVGQTSPYGSFDLWNAGGPAGRRSTHGVNFGQNCFWSPDGRYAVLAFSASPHILIFDWISGSPVQLPAPVEPPSGSLWGGAFAPDSKTFFLSGTNPIEGYSLETGVAVKLAPSPLFTGSGREALTIKKVA